MEAAIMSTAGVIVAVVSTFATFLLVARIVDNDLYSLLGAIALTGHAILAALILRILPYQWDIGKFHQHAVNILSGIPIEANPTVNSFAAFQSLVYAIFGSDPTVVSVVNGLLAVFIAIPASYLARCIYTDLDSSDGVIASVLFLPLPFLFLSIPMRDALNVLIFFMILAGIVRAFTTKNLALAFPVIPLFGMLTLLRRELAFIIVLGVILGGLVIVSDTVLKQPIGFPSMFALGGLVGLISIPLIGPQIPVERIEGMMVGRTRGGAAYLEGATYETWIDLVLAAPIRAIYFQFAPFPLHVTSVFGLLAAAMAPVIIVLSVAAYRSIRERKTSRPLLVGLLGVYLMGILGYGLVDANFGTTVRHRIPFTFLLLIFAAPVLERWMRLIRARLRQRPS